MKWINTAGKHKRKALNSVQRPGVLPHTHVLQEAINDCTGPMSHQPETVWAISLINKRATASARWVDYSSSCSRRPFDSWFSKVLAGVRYWYLLRVKMRLMNICFAFGPVQDVLAQYVCASGCLHVVWIEWIVLCVWPNSCGTQDTIHILPQNLKYKRFFVRLNLTDTLIQSEPQKIKNKQWSKLSQ